MDEKALIEAEDLILVPQFQQHIRSATAESERYWQAWREHSALHENQYSKARLLLLALDEQYRDDLSEEDLNRSLQILSEKALNFESRSPSLKIPFTWWKVAALLIFGMGLGYWWYRNTETMAPQNQMAEVTDINASGEKIIRNLSDSAQTTLLDDGSVVILSANSSMKIGTDYDLKDRRVQIWGEAYFEVFPNPNKPFVVLLGQTMTRVLGTKFTLSTQKDRNSVHLSVHSGKVAFYKSDENASFEKSIGLILTANQQALYRAQDQSMQRLRVPTKAPESLQEYIYDDTPVAVVLMQLEQQYGMEIIFEKEIFSDCPITTSFTKESLLERIDIICQAVAAHYEIENGKIRISGPGCPAH
ncbi:FecR family protein [Dyadobacter tibetensis]|uniref:FecR family protein n=1 Tax=Dyadobacter tibetensis TaxID=1211851 RepID=UPI00046F51BA|nr:FecR family protein [Dyadobacter tibetensis]